MKVIGHLRVSTADQDTEKNKKKNKSVRVYKLLTHSKTEN